jgi:hypothetical protein
MSAAPLMMESMAMAAQELTRFTTPMHIYQRRAREACVALNFPVVPCATPQLVHRPALVMSHQCTILLPFVRIPVTSI